MFTEKELKNLLKQKEKERKYLKYKKLEEADKLRIDFILTIEINLLRKILGGTKECQNQKEY